MNLKFQKPTVYLFWSQLYVVILELEYFTAWAEFGKEAILEGLNERLAGDGNDRVGGVDDEQRLVQHLVGEHGQVVRHEQQLLQWTFLKGHAFSFYSLIKSFVKDCLRYGILLSFIIINRSGNSAAQTYRCLVEQSEKISKEAAPLLTRRA